MSYRRLMIASAATTAALTGIAWVALGRAPAGYRLPTHWNMAGEPDRFASAAQALFVPPVLVVVTSVLLALVPYIEPLQYRLEKSAPLYRTAWIGLLALMAMLELVLAAPLLFGAAVPPTTPMAAAGILLIAIGNMLPKSRPNFFVGIRTPWTLTDEDNWIATHQIGGWAMMAAGVMIALAAVAPIDAGLRVTVVIASVTVSVVLPPTYSFFFWWRHTREA